MPLEMVPLGEGRFTVRQSFDSPTVYLDHWALMTFAEDSSLQDRFVNAISSKHGTLLVSSISLGDLSGPSDARHALGVASMLDRLMPHVYLTDCGHDKILERELLEPDNRRRFWPTADLPQLKALGEVAVTSSLATALQPLVLSTHIHRDHARSATLDMISMMRDGFQAAKSDPAYVRRVKAARPSNARPRTLLIMGELMRGFNLDPGARLSDNDLMDFLHAAVASNCCDFALLDGPWVSRVDEMVRRVAREGVEMSIAKCYSRTRHGGVEGFLQDLQAFTVPDAPAVP